MAVDQVLVEPAPELVSHNDVTPQNVFVRDGRAVALVDFDMAGSTTRLIDVYNTAMHWVPLRDPADIWPTWTGLDQPGRLRVLADAYDLTDSQRLSLIDLGVLRADRSWLLMKGAIEHHGGGWARMWHDDVGELIRRRQAWLTANRGSFLAALSGHSVRHGATDWRSRTAHPTAGGQVRCAPVLPAVLRGSSRFQHQYSRARIGSWAVPHASGNCVQVHRVKRDRQVGQVKVQPPGEEEEELIGVVVNMFGEVTGDVGNLDVVVVALPGTRDARAAASTAEDSSSFLAAPHAVPKVLPAPS